MISTRVRDTLNRFLVSWVWRILIYSDGCGKVEIFSGNGTWRMLIEFISTKDLISQIKQLQSEKETPK